MIKKNIFVIDDEDAMLFLYETFLREGGYNVFTFSCHDEAIKKVEEIVPDAVLVDFYLKGITGDEVAKKFYEKNINKVICCSGDDKHEDLFSSFIPKPLDFVGLSSKITKMLE